MNTMKFAHSTSSISFSGHLHKRLMWVCVLTILAAPTVSLADVERPENRPSRYGIGYEYRMEHENIERVEPGGTWSRPERPQHTDRPERPERPDSIERVERPDRIERPERPERPERADVPERPERIERPGR